MNAAIWWRVSTRAQLEGSPDTQNKEARELLEAQGYTVPDEYIIGAE
jgi:DNA invertase Pin-like site-specific DNA recombinase